MDNPTRQTLEPRSGRQTGSARSRATLASLVALALLGLAGCGNSDGSASPATPTGTDQATGSTPVKVGLLNPVNGGATAPGASQGANAGVAFANGNLGGIGGRPVQVVNCDVDVLSPESNINCANQFAKDGVVAVIDAFNPSAGAALPILQSAKIPIIGPLAFDPTLGSAPDSRVYFGPAPAAFLLGAMQSLKEQGFSSITLANLDDPTGHATIDKILKPLGAQLGLDVKAIYFPPANPNFNVLASSIKSTGSEVAGLLVTLNEAMCTNLFKAMVNVGFDGTPFMASCSNFIGKLGSKAVGAETYSSVWLPQAQKQAPAEIQKNLSAAAPYMAAERGPSDWNAYAAFATVVDLTRILDQAKVSNPTGESVLSTLKAVKGYQSFLGPQLDCTRPTSPNCTTEIYNFKVTAPNTMEAVGGGTIHPAEQALKAVPGAS
ncbi:ABC transporter substrate-binding protein [Nocardioides marmoriginsengisoli]|uniref:ABC transporter substrate-binding protein n=1 Tax=Nocardioides marmoriginsengisoli TaxID=661483 RepID=A0A3N0CHJ6_9ACTN|nr:ABC transporter substrate-binding protein [Nocardioides marmoriginsengisoli]RNL62731.1 ABC transporter substrate-binding protein [Nocardioides marmoriginsengisoli]